MASIFNFWHRNRQVKPENEIHNSNFNTFNSFRQNVENIVVSRSVVNKSIEEENKLTPSFDTVIDHMESVMPVATDKQTRIKQYRTIGAFPECDWCLDEIADDFLHEDEKGNFINLILPENKDNLDLNRKEILQNEFRKFINLFNFKNNGFNLMKKFLIEGELAWENIINPEHPDLGIIGLKFLPTEYYETLVNSNTGQKIGIYFDVKKYADDIKQLISMSYYGSYKIFNNIIGAEPVYANRDDCIALLWPQVTYISSSDVSPDGMICFPLIDKCKQAYYQLVLLQDSAVILRVTHAPERLLFNISTGGMSDKVAEGYVRRFANELKQKKVLEQGKNGPKITNLYNPSTMLESWIFGKSNQNDGTSVESVGSNVTYDQIDDIKFFLKRLLKQFKVPFTRFESPEQMNERNEQMSYEEYDFSRQEIRLQRRFADGLKKGFITHLRLRKIWEKYGLKDSDIDIQFVKPVLYDLYQTQKLMEAKVAAYATIADRDEFSKMVAMRNILGMTDDEIKDNFSNLEKEKCLLGRAEWYEEQIKSNGPKIPKPPIPIKDVGGEEGSEEGGEESSGEGENEEEESKNEESWPGDEEGVNEEPNEETPPEESETPQKEKSETPPEENKE